AEREASSVRQADELGPLRSSSICRGRDAQCRIGIAISFRRNGIDGQAPAGSWKAHIHRPVLEVSEEDDREGRRVRAHSEERRNLGQRSAVWTVARPPYG